MRYRIRLSALVTALLLTPVALAQQTFTMFERSYEPAGDATVRVDVADADFSVETGSGNGFQVEILVRASDPDLARRYYEAQQYSVAFTGGILEVRDAPSNGFRVNWKRGDYAQAHIGISAPESIDLRLRTSDGDLFVGDVNGDVYVRTSDGNISADRLVGVMFEARTSDGNIIVESAEFKNVVLHTSDGDIVVEHADAEEVTAITSDGDIHFGQLLGIADVRTSDGDIHMGSLQSSSGKVRTSDGNIVLESVDGKLTASTSDGNVVVDLVRPDAIMLKTSDGDIVVSVPDDHGARLSLTGNRVSMDCCPSFEGKKTQRHIEGVVNGGGVPIQLSASDGMVVLRAR